MAKEDKKSARLDKSGIAIIIAVIGILCVYFGFSKTVDDIPEAQMTVLAGAREAGFDFDSTLMKVSGEESMETATIDGPMVGPREIPAPGTEAPEKSYEDCIPYVSLTLEWQDHSWVAVSAVKDSRYE